MFHPTHGLFPVYGPCQEGYGPRTTGCKKHAIKTLGTTPKPTLISGSAATKVRVRLVRNRS